MLESHILLERYRLERLLGKGGMGRVYLAEDIYDHSFWAVKIEDLHEKNLEFVRSEINIQAGLDHPALPKIRQYFESDGRLYIVMEFVEGQTLEDILNRNGIISEQDTIKWLRQINDVLIYLHGRSTPIVYRDLKPSNIMIQPTGNIKIIDFGIAQEYSKGKKLSRNKMALTRGYAAPEQYDNRYCADVRTDIYALGVTAHYMLTGKNPNKPPYYFRPVRKLNPKVSYAAEYIVRKCIQPNPDRRYAGALELQKDLEQIRILEINLKKKRNRRKAGVCILLAGILCLASLVFVGIRKQRAEVIERYYTCLEDARSYMSENAYDEAVQKYKEAINIQPEAWEAYIELATLYLEEGDQEQCRQCLKTASDKFPELFEDERFIEITEELYELYGM